MRGKNFKVSLVSREYFRVKFVLETIYALAPLLRSTTKMIVPIKRNGIIEDWAIIDLQGDLKFEKVDNLDDQLVGDLHFTKTGIPILIIGIHVLHGKEVALEKPVVVLERHHTNFQDVATIEEQDPKIETEYIIKAIVKKKLIFKSRPKPIVTNVPKRC